MGEGTLRGGAMKITKQELHHIIKEELEKVLYEVVNPKTVNWEEIQSKYLAAVYQSDHGLGFEAAKDKVRSDIEQAKQAGGLEQLVAAAKEEFDIDLMKMDEAKNKYAVCTASIAKTAGTSKRSEWAEAEMKRYERCKEKV